MKRKGGSHALFESYLPYTLDAIENVLGEGSFGCSVYGSSELNPESKALVKIARVDTQVAQTEFLKEIDIHETLHLLVPLHVPDFVGVDHTENFPLPFRTKIQKKCPVLAEEWKKKGWKGEFY